MVEGLVSMNKRKSSFFTYYTLRIASLINIIIMVLIMFIALSLLVVFTHAVKIKQDSVVIRL